MKKWHKNLLIAGSALTLTGLACGYYATAIEPNRLILHEETLNVPHWNKNLNGFRILAISDLHGDEDVVDEARLHQVVELANAQGADIIVLLGDYVSEVDDSKTREMKMPMEKIADGLAGLRAKYGIYAVIGNHDWWYDERKVRGELERVGFKVLENETASLRVNDQTISIIGIEDFWKRHQVKIDNLLANVILQENIIALAHNPDSFQFTSDKISLVMSGHTHGGQVSLPLIGAPIIKSKREYTRGHIVENGRNLFVTTGIGVSNLPVRFGVPPEIAVITLNSES